MKLLICFIYLFFLSSARAAFNIELFGNYTSDTDNVDNESYSKMYYGLFLGASLDGKQTFYFGQNIMMHTREIKGAGASQASTLSVTELGPRFTLFMGDTQSWALSVAWHPYAKGERQRSGQTEEISGWAYLASFGYTLKLSRAFALGANITYHALNISKSVDSGNTESEVSHSYTNIIPMIVISFRFR